MIGDVRIMGIVNASPDSFADRVGSRGFAAQLDHAQALLADGADLLDIGGESGVTHTAPTPWEVEAERVVPLVAALANDGVAVSVDTWKAEVAERALAAGAQVINDTSALADPRIAELVAQAGATLIVLHTRAAPKAESFPAYEDVVADVLALLRERAAIALAAGIPAAQLWLDPGPDFAKRPEESVAVLGAMGQVVALGHPVLLAVSRKYFLGTATGRGPSARGAATLAAIGEGVDAGARIVRVHDVAATVDFLRVRRVLRGEEPMAPYDAGDVALKWLSPPEPGPGPGLGPTPAA